MTGRWLDQWREVGVPVREVRTDFAESAQGVATDGLRWFVISNRSIEGAMRWSTDPLSLLDRYRNSRRIGVYGLDGRSHGEIAPDAAIWAELVRLNRRDYPSERVHLGAPAWTDGTLLVPTQRPSGVWVLTDDVTRQDWWPDPAPVHPERWSWIDRDPSNGLLYTSLHWHPRELEALEWQTLQRVPSADIHLADVSPELDRVQGGAFTAGGRIILTSSEEGGRIYCYSAATGESLGVRRVGTYFEMEGVAVHPVRVGGELAQVHILEAATEYIPFLRWGDSFFVRSYAVPDPGAL